ncbi:MAG: cytochrome c3 family protein [Planctomycetota bacterium]
MGMPGGLWTIGLLYIAIFVPNSRGDAECHGVRGPGEKGRGADVTVCLDCHQFPDRLTHPIGVRVERAGELPLGPGGTVECATCHDPGKHESGGVRGAALRLPGPDLCRECHREGEQKSRVEHGIAVGRAHFTSSGVRLTSYGIDAMTRECMGCHDGSVAAERSETPVIGQKGSHPIGRVYDEGSRAGRKGHLRPRQELPGEVQLVGDSIGCQTCHSPYSRLPDMVTAPMKDSRLCTSCHAM